MDTVVLVYGLAVSDSLCVLVLVQNAMFTPSASLTVGSCLQLAVLNVCVEEWSLASREDPSNLLPQNDPHRHTLLRSRAHRPNSLALPSRPYCP